jgi:phage shock protein C
MQAWNRVWRIHVKRLYRSLKDKNIAGICGGLGEMFSVDSTLIRLAVVFIAVALVIINGAVAGILPLILAYIVGWIIVPVAPAHEEEKDEGRMKKIFRSEKDKKIAGICGGLGEMFSVDSTLIRLAVVFIGLVTGILPIIIAYIVGWMIIPVGPSQHEQGEDQKNGTTT